MKLFGVRQTWLGAVLIVAASCISCNQQPANNVVKNAKPTPEESFRVIADTFRRRMEETPVGFVATDASSRTSMIGTNTVTSELIPPAKPDEPYKATITVVSQSKYSIKRSKEVPDEKSREKDAPASGDIPLASPGEKGVESFDPALISKSTPDAVNPRATEDVIARRPEKDERKYELTYRNGRWTLDTELDKETEQATQNAFKNALETQI